MRLGNRIVLIVAVIGVAVWTAIPLWGTLSIQDLGSATASLAAPALNEFLGRLALFASFTAGAILIGHTLRRLRWSERRTSHVDDLLKTARDMVPFRHDQSDRYALLKEACARLRHARGYESVWMACLDANGRADVAVHDGCKGPFGSLIVDMKEARWPACAEQALAKSGPILIRDVVGQCVGCTLHEKRYGRGALAIRIETEGRVYGVLCVKAPPDALSGPDEQAVLTRVSRDMGHALKSIELEKRHAETADELGFRRALGEAVARATSASTASDVPLHPVARSVLEDILTMVEGRSAAAYRLDHRTNEFTLATSVGEAEERPGEAGTFPETVSSEEAARMEAAWLSFCDRSDASARAAEAIETDPPQEAPSTASGERTIATRVHARGEAVGLIVVRASGTTPAYGESDAVLTLAACYADACRDTELREEVEVDRAAVSGSPFPILVLNDEGVIVHANESLCRLWHLSDPADLAGTEQTRLWESAELGHGMLKKLQDSGSWSGELVGSREDGTWMRVRVSATASGGADLPRRYALTIMDLTEIRLSETTVKVFGRIAAAACSCDRPRELFLETRQELGRVLDARNFLVATLETDGKRVSLPFFLDEKDQNQFSELPPGKTLTARVIETGKPVLLNSRDIEEMSSRDELDIVGSPCQSWLGVPLMDGESIIGVMAVQSYTAPDEYGDHEIAVMSHAADIVSAGLERIRSRDELAESNGRSDAVAQTITSGLVDTDSKGRIISWNKAAETLFGYHASEAVGKPFSMIVPEGFLQAHVDGLMRAVSSEGQGYVRASVEGVGLRKDGSEFPMELSIGAWRAGEETFFTAVLSDATSRKQTEEELQFLSSIPLQVSDALIVTDLNFRITYVNKAAEFLFSYPREELIGRTLDLLSVESWDDSLGDEIHQTVSAGRFWSGTQRSRRKDGSSFVVEYRVSPLRDRAGRLTSYISIFHDVTERKRGEQLLQTLNAAALGMERSLTPDQVLEAVGSELETIGFSCAVLALEEGSDAVSLTYSSPGIARPQESDLDSDENPLMPLASLPPILRTVEERRAILLEKENADAGKAGSGTERAHWLVKALSERSSIVVPLIAGLDVVGALAVTSDRLSRSDIPAVTAFGNQLAAAWRKANLMQELEGSLRELRRTQNILLHAQKMEAVGNLAGGVAHDFNNLLTAIRGYTELLLDQFDEEDAVYSDLMEIKKASEQASGVTGQLLAFSRQQPLEPSPVVVNEVVTSVDKMLRRLIGEDVELVSVLDPELGMVRADSTQIQQVVINLAINARDAMPEGGTLTIRTDNVDLGEEEVASKPEASPGRYVLLSVGDTGTGVDPKAMDRIFEPFFTTKGPGKGTGLGLSVVYGIVTQHGGWIDVTSESGSGTLFRIYLPTTEEKALERKGDTVKQRKPVRSSGHHESVMIVEDEETVRSFAARALRQGGYDVVETGSAEEAVELLKAGRDVDLVFTDVILSSKSGLELVEELQSLRPGMPALLSSGYADQKSHWELIQERGLPFLKKPYAVADLLSRVKDLLEESAAEGSGTPV